MLSTVLDYLRTAKTGLELVVFCVCEPDALAAFEDKLTAYTTSA
jgi:hypothetical protein